MHKLRQALFNIRNHRNPIRFVLSRLLPMARLEQFFTIPRPSHRLRFQNSAMSKKVFADPGFGRDELALVTALIDDGDIVFDVGANIGDYTIACAEAVGPRDGFTHSSRTLES